MLKKVLMALLVWSAFFGTSWAQSWEMDLSAGTTSATGGVHYRQFIDTGFFQIGGTGIYGNHGAESYRIGSIDFAVGSDTLLPGLTIDVGVRGLFGSAERDLLSGNIGAVGFTGYSEYVFSKNIFPIPVEIFGSVTYAPDILSFLDSKNYLEFNLGSGLKIGRYASIRLSYSALRAEILHDNGSWTFSDDAVRLGLIMHF